MRAEDATMKQNLDLSYVNVQFSMLSEKVMFISILTVSTQRAHNYTYQDRRNISTPNVLAPPGLTPLPQQRQRVASIMIIWEIVKKMNDPAANPVDTSEEYSHVNRPVF